MKTIVGTRAFGGLNVKTAPHLIADHELQESVNGWTDQDGAWSVAKRPEVLYSSSDIVAYEAGRMGGADHHVWISGTTLYDNGTSVGTVSGADSNTDIKAIDDAFLIVAADKNYIYDGNHLREQGAWQADYIYSINETGTASSFSTITDMTEGATTVIELNANWFTPGDRIKISGISVGPTELNGKYFTVTATSGIGANETITIQADTSASTAWSSGGDVDPATDLSGTYRWYIVPCIKLSDGTVLTGKPRGLMVESETYLPIAYFDLGPTDQTEATPLSLSGGEYVEIGQGHGSPTETCRIYFNVGGTALFDITGTAGADYYRGARLYRTKANGYDIYLERELYEDEDFCAAFTDGSDAGIDLKTMYPGIPDIDLGAALDYSLTEHTNPPQSEVATLAGQRVWLADGDTLHWSMLDGPEYYSASGSTKMYDTITALGSWQDYCIVFSADRMWAVRIIGGLPAVEEIATPAGTIWPKAVRQTSIGLLYLRTDGLYAYSGSYPQKISRAAFDDILSPQSVVQAGDVLYLSGSEEAYVALNRDNKWEWHESEHYLPYASQTSGSLYAASTSQVKSLFTGARTEGRLKTKLWGGFDSACSYKAEIDFAGDVVPRILLNGNVMSDVQEHAATAPYSYPDRRILWVHVPRLTNNYVDVEFEMMGNATVYGVRVEQEF